MATIDLKALRFPFKDPKFIFFTDFDGTITLKDSNDFMVSSCLSQHGLISKNKSTNQYRPTTLVSVPSCASRATRMSSRAGRLSGKL